MSVSGKQLAEYVVVKGALQSNDLLLKPVVTVVGAVFNEVSLLRRRF